MSHRQDRRRYSSRHLIVAAAGLVTLLAAPATSTFGKVSSARSTVGQQIRLGVYDPYGTFRNVDGIAVEHIYLPWIDSDLSSLNAADRYARARHRDVLLTIEPWSWTPYRNVSAKALYNGIMNDRYAGNIMHVCDRAGRMKASVTVRWGHEMDTRNGRYPWSQWLAPDYAKAYRRFVDTCRKAATNLKFMWSPRGESDLVAYYPGDAYVDSVGISVFALQRYDRAKFGRDRTLREIVEPTYRRLERYKKPIALAEFGCVGDRRYRRRCHDELATLGRHFPGVVTVIYFNEKEPYPCPNPYRRPDWRVPGWLVGKPVSTTITRPKTSTTAQ